MVRNRNGYWMYHKFLSPDDGGGAGAGGADAGSAAGADAGADAGTAGEGGEGANQGGSDGGKDNTDLESLKATIARMEAEAAKNKSALDKATKEAGDLRKELRSKMTAEQIAAKEKEEAEEAQKNRIIELEKQVAKTNTVKTVMGKLGLDETAAGNLADCLFGAADIENALLEIQKGWQAREAALKKEYGKITGPGAGADSNSPEAQGIARAVELGKKQKAVNEQAQKALSAYIR